MITLKIFFPFFSWVKSQELVYDEIFIIKTFLRSSGLMVKAHTSLAPVTLGVRCIFLSVILYAAL